MDNQFQSVQEPKKIQTIIPIIVIAILVIGGVVWWFGRTGLNKPEACQDGWKYYRHNVIGIEFCYPEEWGEPVTGSIENITRLSDMEETFKMQNIFYTNALAINFEESGAHLELFNDQHDGKSERGIDEPYIYYDSGLSGDVVNLKKTGDICGYNIGYTYRYNPEMEQNILKTIYSGCEKKVKTILTRDEQFFDMDNIGTLYSYDLKFLAFKKLSNGYFDNVLVSRSFDHINQIIEKLGTLDDFFDKEKTRHYGDKVQARTREQFSQEREEFEQFVSSIKAFKPVSETRDKFEKISGEDPKVTTIRKYYWLVAAGKLEEAYDMYADKAVGLDEFKERYQYAYFADPSGFKNIGGNSYEFQVDYQDHNSPKEKFRVKMEVNDNTVRTTFLEEYLTDIVSYGDMAAYAARRGDRNYILLDKDGGETVVDQGDNQYQDDFSNLSEVKYFSDLRFSADGNYLMYLMSGWEWGVGYIYDIRAGKTITGAVADDLEGAHTFDFADNENYFYLCSSAGMASGTGGKVYSVPGFKVEYNILNDSRSQGFMGVNCSYEDNSIKFELGDYYSSEGYQEGKTLDLKFDLSD